MHKKLSFLLICLVGACFFSTPSLAQAGEYCAFCDQAVLDYQTFYEDELVLALYTHKPIFPGHCLVVPKRHAERFDMLTDEEMVHIGTVIKKVDRAAMKVFGASSYLLLQKNGSEVGQSVPHVHFHYIPRKAGNNSSIEFIIKMYLANAKRPIPEHEMHEHVEKMRQAMESKESYTQKK